MQSQLVFEIEGGDQGNASAATAGKIRMLVEFSKGAYEVQSWENKLINDLSLGSEEAWHGLKAKGWQAVGLGIDANLTSHVSSSISFQTKNSDGDGFYTWANAGALVSVQDDALVVAFRGENDMGFYGLNPKDADNNYHPDADSAALSAPNSDDSMSRHYGFYDRLFSSVDNYLAIHPEIETVYVTGHGLGGAMALEYMSQHPDETRRYESVVYSALPFIEARDSDGAAGYKNYASDDRIMQVEIEGDPATIAWEQLAGSSRPGTLVMLAGDQMLNTPDNYNGHAVRLANQSIDYYQQMIAALDLQAWQQMLEGNQVQTLLTSAQALGEGFIVGQGNDLIQGQGADIVYGGHGNDQLMGTSEGETILASDGDDVLRGQAGADLLIGAAGNDQLSGGEDEDQLYGGSGDDRLYGESGIDQLYGGAGADLLSGGAGADRVEGGAGNDVIYAEGNDIIAGGAGWDRLEIGGRSADYQTGLMQHQGSYLTSLSGKGELIGFQGVEWIQFTDAGYPTSQLFPLAEVIQQYAAPEHKNEVEFQVPEAETVWFLVELDAPATSIASVNYSTRDGTAIAGRDYVASSGVLSLEPGQTQLAVEVQLIDDDIIEVAETFSLVLTSPHGGNFAGSLPELIAQRTILDDDGVFLI